MVCVGLICPLYFQPGSGGAADSAEDWKSVWDNWRPLTMAGIFDCWEPPEGGDLLYSYTIITVDSCRNLHDIHHRQAFRVPCWGLNPEVLSYNPNHFFLILRQVLAKLPGLVSSSPLAALASASWVARIIGMHQPCPTQVTLTVPGSERMQMRVYPLCFWIGSFKE